MWKFIEKSFKIILLCSFAFIALILLDVAFFDNNNVVIFKYKHFICSFFLCLLLLLSVYGTCLVFYKSRIIFKTVILLLVLVCLLLYSIYLYNNSNLFSRFKSVTDLREYIKTFKRMVYK